MKRISILFLMWIHVAFASGEIHWRPWSEKIFEKAKRNGTFVLVHAHKNWCQDHQSMLKNVYQTPEVIKLIKTKFIATQVNLDDHPDFEQYYRSEECPITVIFTPDAMEVFKQSGFIGAKDFVSILRSIHKKNIPVASAVLKDSVVLPTPLSKTTGLSSETEKVLLQEYLAAYDSKKGGWGSMIKSLQAGAIEYAMRMSEDAQQEKMARQTLDQALLLMDSEWGGIYQNTTSSKWAPSDFGKSTEMQAELITQLVYGYKLWRQEKYIQAAKKNYTYLKKFLSNAVGVFYTGQSGILSSGISSKEYFSLTGEKRRLKGVPEVNKNIYTRFNGQVVFALSQLYQLTEEKDYILQARKIADWIIEHRQIPGRGFQYGEKDSRGPYLADTLTMGRAFLALYQSTAEKQWLDKAQEAARWIQKFYLLNGKGGYVSGVVSDSATGVFKDVMLDREENIQVGRFLNLLFHYTGNEIYFQGCLQALKFVIASMDNPPNKFLPGLLLLNMESKNKPIHITVVGSKKDPKASTLFFAALQYPSFYSRIDWWDNAEQPLLNSMQYPLLQKPAVFVCTTKGCSLPVFDSEKITEAVRQFSLEK